MEKDLVKGIEKWSRNIIVIFVLMLIIGFNELLVNAEEIKEQSNKTGIQVEVTYGIEGKYKINKTTPINLNITNTGGDFEGKIQIQTDSFNAKQYDLYTQSLVIAKDTNKNIVMAVNLLNTFTVKIVSMDNKIIYEKDFRVTSGRAGVNEALIGVLTDDFNGLSYLSNIKLEDNREINLKFTPIKISEKVIGDNARSIDLLDMIIINNYDTSKFTEEQIQSIDNWIKRGGTLILGTGVNVNKVISPLNNKVIKGSFSEPVGMELIFDDKKSEFQSIRMNIDKAIPIHKDIKNNVMVGNVKKEQGNVLVFSFDIAVNQITNEEFWITVMKDSIKYNNLNNQYNYSIDNLVKKIKDIELPSEKLIIILFIGYILIITVLIYIVLKRINKRDYVWILIPVISLAFTASIYFIGSKSRINHVIANKINIVKVDEGGKALIESYIGFLTSKKRDISIKEPGNLEMDNISAYVDPYSQDQSNKFKNKDMRVEINYEGEDTYYNFKETSPFTPEIFKVTNINEEFENIDNELNFVNGELSGYINNNIGCNIEKILLITPYRIWDLGEFKDGEKKEFYEKKDSIFSTKQVWELRDKLWNQYNNTKGKDKLKFNMRTLELINSVTQNDARTMSLPNDMKRGSFLVAVTDKEIKYNLLVNSKEPVNFDSTVFSFPVIVNFKDKNGNVNYPYGYFQPSVIDKNDKDGYFDVFESRLSGNASVSLSYTLDESISIEKLSFKKPAINNMGGSSFKGEVKIYNFSTNKFEVIDVSKEIDIIDPNKYIKNNEIRVDIKGKNEEYASIPEFTVKGREK